MSDPVAIRLNNVSKTYQFFSSKSDQVIHELGLRRIGIRPRHKPMPFVALDSVSLEVPVGKRIGIVGRNGAGKTTLLKLIAGNFAPSEGTIEVNGDVQALFSVGVGFHPEFSGIENARAALSFSDLTQEQMDAAIADVVDFCELGEFIDRPFGKYSMGMQARLMFAVSTAVRPDIMIVDEVLGAGDAYFVAKSKRRVEQLVASGCSMILVSHSMPQVLELCSEVVWLDKGRVRRRGAAFDVVKEYEEWIHSPQMSPAGPSKMLGADDGAEAGDESEETSDAAADKSGKEGAPETDQMFITQDRDLERLALGSEARVGTERIARVATPDAFDFVARGGLSRWKGSGELEISGFTMATAHGKTNKLFPMMPVTFVLAISVREDGDYACRYGISFYDHLGRILCNLISPVDRFEGKAGEVRRAEVVLDQTLLGPDEYTLSVSVNDGFELPAINSSKRYDLLNRSFQANVTLPDSLQAVSSAFYQPSDWRFGND